MHEPGEVSEANMKMPIDSTRLLIYAQEPHIFQHHLRILQTGTDAWPPCGGQTEVCVDFSAMGDTISNERY